MCGAEIAPRRTAQAARPPARTPSLDEERPPAEQPFQPSLPPHGASGEVPCPRRAPKWPQNGMGGGEERGQTMQETPSETRLLLQRLREGDRGALDALVARDLDWIRGYVRRRLGNALRSRMES